MKELHRPVSGFFSGASDQQSSHPAPTLLHFYCTSSRRRVLKLACQGRSRNSLPAHLLAQESTLTEPATKVVVAAPRPATQLRAAAKGQRCNSKEPALGLQDPSLMPTASCVTLVKEYKLGFTKLGLLKPCRP